MLQPFDLSAAEAARKVRSRELSPVALVESLLTRIDRLEPRLQAWVRVERESALTEARRKEAELAEAPAEPSPRRVTSRPSSRTPTAGLLYGVPIGLKDIFYTAGVPTTACSKVYANFVPEYDGTAVAKLKQAGAIILGKTVTTEFACMDPSPTVNPWNPAHTPGGSSSGSAVAVAARMCPAALGSQTVGSTLRPAVYNGIVGFKPTFGRVSRYGVVPVSWSLDTVGWLVRNVEDAALLCQVLAGPDLQDPAASVQPVPDYLSGLQKPKAPRIGLLRQFFYDRADAATQQHLDSVAERLALAGANVVELPLPDSIDTAFADQRVIMDVEGAAFHQPMYQRQAQDYQPRLREMIGRGLATDGVSYSRALERRLRFTADVERLAGRVDVLLTPATPTPPQADRSNTGNALFQGPWTSAGLPAIAIPSGVAASGLPLGIQLAAAPFAEARLLAAARWCEMILDQHLRPPLGD